MLRSVDGAICIKSNDPMISKVKDVGRESNLRKKGKSDKDERINRVANT